MIRYFNIHFLVHFITDFAKNLLTYTIHVHCFIKRHSMSQALECYMRLSAQFS